MKTELNISTLSIVCVLGAVISLPSFGASAVRSLGGVGTYSSASSAATAGAKPSTEATNSVRAGSVRAKDAKSATSSKLSSTRTAATPRLSIGKYLSGGSVSGKPGTSTGGSMGNSQAGIDDKLKQKVDQLDETVSDLVVDVEGLKEEIAGLTGERPEISFQDGVLTIVQDGVSEEIDLNDYFASEDALQELEDKINEIVIPDLSEYAKKSELEGLLTSADLSELQSAVDALESADVSMNAAIAALQGGMITADALAAKVAELKAVDDGLQAQIDNLKNSTPSTEGLVNKDYVDGLVGQLEAADVALQNAIAAIEQPDVDKAYVDAAIADLNDAIGALQGADSTMEQAIANLQARLDDAATKEEIKDFVKSAEVDAKIQEVVAGLATDEEIKDFVTNGKLQEEIAKLATQDQIKDFITSDYVSAAIAGLQTAEDVSQAIEDAAASTLATKQELADAKSELQAAIDSINAGQVELTNYYTKAEAEEMFATKDMIKDYMAGENISISEDGVISATDTDTTYTAGDNVTIENGVISATDTTYTAGDNVTIENGVISATDTTYTAGDNITIEGGVISATDADTTYTAGDNVTIENGVISATDTDTTYTAGDNVTIENGVISATDTTYTAGDNITIEGGVISAKDTTYTAGDNVTIENGVISATDTDTTYTAGDNITIEGGVISATGVAKLYDTTGDNVDGAMTQEAVTVQLNAISETLDNFNLDKVLRPAAQGSYLVNFDAEGNVSYTPIAIVGEDFKNLDLTQDAILPSTTLSLK